jgi:SPP1 gp7 family putative phage head morphogenesis protein
MKWGAHQVDGRIAANNAVKIRAALRNSIDAKKVFEEYQLTQPNVSDNQAQDRARARSWSMLHIQVDNSALITALQRLWAEMWVAGDLSAAEAIQQAKEMKKADDIATIDWDTWKPGDAATALLLQPPKAFKDLLEASGVMIQGLDKTGYERVGTALADSIRLGLSPNRAAKLINEAIGDAARALTIAITESSRAMNAGAINRYKEAKLNQMEWMTVLSVVGGSSACDICAPNAGQQVEIGQAFNSGSYQPPAHPHCRCTLLPVIPDYSANEHGVVDVAPKPIGITHAGVSESALLKWSNEKNADYIARGKTKAPGNGLRIAQKTNNYNGLPTVLSPDEFAVAAKSADVKIFRGIANNGATKASVYVDQYLTGEHYPGLGLFGNGTYTSTRLATAKKYAGKNGEIMDMLIPDTSNFISVPDLKLKRLEMEKSIRERFVSSTGDEREALKLLLNSLSTDPSVVACFLGYDGIIATSADWTLSNDSEKYYVILNRAKAVVKGK